MEYSKKKRVLMLIAITLFNLAIVSFGTYALWTSTDLLTDNNSITTGQVKMSYTETNEIGMTNALPIKDSEGKVLTNYFDFQVLTYIKTRANDDTKRKLNYNIVLEPLTVDNPLNDSEIKVYLTKVENGNETVVVEPTTIDKLTDKILSSKEEIFSNNKGEVVTSYRLRAWIDSDVDVNKLNDKSYSYKFRVNINNEKSTEIVPILNIPVGTDGLEKVTHEIDDTLQVDSKFATEYRYRGGDSVVNNYVAFNNETWRIIGVMPTEDINGDVENRLKIVIDTSIGNYYWNENGTNDWTVATLNTYLNNDYYNTLSDDAKNMIGTTKYYLGGYSLNDDTFTSDEMWQYERKNETNRTGYYYGSNSIMQNDTNKKIALMYASDGGYSASKKCSRGLMYYYEDSNCIASNNWLDKSKLEWSITQTSSMSNFTFFVGGGHAIVDNEFMVRPTLTLSSNVKISGGSGSSSDPYTLSVN